MQATFVNPFLHMYFISSGKKSLIKHYGFIHQTVIVILVSMIRISYVSKFGKFGRCQKGKVSFANELAIAISSHTHTHTHTKTTSNSNLRVYLTNCFNRLSLVVFVKSIWEYLYSFIYFFNRLSFVLFWNF